MVKDASLFLSAKGAGLYIPNTIRIIFAEKLVLNEYRQCDSIIVVFTLGD